MQQGWTITDLRQYYHCRHEAIRNVLLKNNIVLRKNISKNKLLKHDFFEIIDTEEKAYILGLLFTDGSVVLDPNGIRNPSITLELSIADIDMLEKIREILGVGGKITINNRKNRKSTATLRFRSKKMAEDLSKYGIIPNKTYLTNHLPNINPHLIIPFLRGLLDGDGSIYKITSTGKWVIDFCSYHRTICEDFRNLCDSFLPIKNLNQIKNYNNKGTTYHIRYYKQEIVKQLATVLYKDNKISLARKNCLAEQIFLEDNSEEDIVYSDLK